MLQCNATSRKPTVFLWLPDLDFRESPGNNIPGGGRELGHPAFAVFFKLSSEWIWIHLMRKGGDMHSLKLFWHGHVRPQFVNVKHIRIIRNGKETGLWCSHHQQTWIQTITGKAHWRESKCDDLGAHTGAGEQNASCSTQTDGSRRVPKYSYKILKCTDYIVVIICTIHFIQENKQNNISLRSKIVNSNSRVNSSFFLF